jgi:membrane fusion protein, multidrug efflux system
MTTVRRRLQAVALDSNFSDSRVSTYVMHLTRLSRGLPLALAASFFLTSCNRGEGAEDPQRQAGQRTAGQNGGAGGGDRAGTGGPGAAGGGQRGGGGQGGFGGFGGPGAGRPSGPTAVEVQPARRGSVAREATVAGVLSPIRSVGVNAQLSGALLTVRVEEGDIVRTGQVLAEVDSRELRAQVRSAEASLALAKSTAERSAALYKDRVVTAAEHERDQAALEAAQASLDALRTRLGYAQVRAPTSGVITEKRVEAGDVVQTQARIFTLADVSTLVVRVQVSELDIAGISEGQATTITFDAVPGTNFRGSIRRIFPAADSLTRMVPVEVALGGSSVSKLKPGYLARVTFRLGERPGVLLTPTTAVVGSRDARAVYLIRGNKAERRLVRVGQQSGEMVEILEGISEGDSIVVAGAEQLRDGAEIRIVAPVGSRPALTTERRRDGKTDGTRDTKRAGRP